MEYEHDDDISFPDHGFYSVQDESHRRYSRTGKHRILAQKYDASLMKYRYSDETEKSSPYSKTLSDSDSPVPSDSAGSYQGVYSPQLAQRNGNFKDTPWTSSREPRRSLIDEESASTWISPGVHPAITGPFEKNRHSYPDALTTDKQFDFENVDPRDHWVTDDSPYRDKLGSIDESEQRPYERTNDETSDDPPHHREPPPPYSVAVRSSKGPAPRSYLDIVPELTKNLQGLPDIDKLLEDLEGSEPHLELPYHNSDCAKPADKLQVDITNQPNVSVWAELIHIDESEDEKPLRPNNGIIITENRDRRASSPDRHIRFVLEAERGQSDPEDITRASGNINWRGPENRELQENGPYDAEVSGDRAYKQHHGEPVGLTPLVDEVFSYPRTSDDAAPEGERSQTYGLDNPGYAYNIEELNNHTSVDQHRSTKKPVSSDIVRRRAIDWYGKGQVYDSSQSSTLDSVFTERSWASDVGQPRAYRQKRRVYPKPKDPVGDLGDGLQSKLGRKTVDKESDRLHQSSSARSRKPGDKDEMGQSRWHGEPSGGEDARQGAQEGDVRRSLIKQELDLFMQRKSGPNKNPTSRRVGPPESRRPSAASSHNSRIASKATSAGPHRPQHRAYIAGEPLNSKGHTQVNSTRVNYRPKPRTFSDEDLHRAVPLRNPALVGKRDRPLTYPNDINRPFSQLIFQEDNNAIRNDLNKINENNLPSQRLRPTQEPRQHHSSQHPHRHGRDDNLRPHEQRPHRPHTTRRPSENKGNLSQLPPKPQRHIRHDDSQPAGHVHPPGNPSLQTHPHHDRHHQYKPSNERRTRENNEITSNMSAVSEVPRRLVRPEPSANTNEKVNHRPVNERRSRGDIEGTSPNIAPVSEVPQLRRDPETPPDHNQQGQQGEQTPASGQKSDTGTFSNHRFFSVMAAIWFFPIGIWALRKSHQVDSHVRAKDLPGARKASKSARNHAIAAFVLFGFIVLILIARLIEITIDPRKTFIQYYEIVPEEVDRI